MPHASIDCDIASGYTIPIIRYCSTMPHNSKLTPTTITSTALQQHYGSCIRRVYKGKEHLVVERDGLPVMVLIPVNDYEALTKNR